MFCLNQNHLYIEQVLDNCWVIFNYNFLPSGWLTWASYRSIAWAFKTALIVRSNHQGTTTTKTTKARDYFYCFACMTLEITFFSTRILNSSWMNNEERKVCRFIYFKSSVLSRLLPFGGGGFFFTSEDFREDYWWSNPRLPF